MSDHDETTNASDSGSPTRSSKLNKKLADDLEYVKHRIAKLRIEADNCDAKARTNERRTKEIAQRRAQAEAETKFRKDLQKKRQHQDDSRKDEISARRMESRERVRESQDNLLEEKREAVMRQKRMQKIYECQVNVHREEEREKSINTHSHIRELEQSGRNRASRQSARKVQAVREEQRIEVLRTSMEREEKESKMAKLKREEEELMERVEAAREHMRKSKAKLERLQSGDSAAAAEDEEEDEPAAANEDEQTPKKKKEKKDKLPPIKKEKQQQNNNDGESTNDNNNQTQEEEKKPGEEKEEEKKEPSKKKAPASESTNNNNSYNSGNNNNSDKKKSSSTKKDPHPPSTPNSKKKGASPSKQHQAKKEPHPPSTPKKTKSATEGEHESKKEETTTAEKPANDDGGSPKKEESTTSDKPQQEQQEEEQRKAEKTKVDWAKLKEKMPTVKNDEQKAKRKELFSQFDPNGNGYLSLAEIDKGCRDVLGLHELFEAKPVIMRAFQTVKALGNKRGKPGEQGEDYVEWIEFRLLLVYLREYFELSEMFDQIDEGGDRRIDLDEFKSSIGMLEEWGVKIDDAEAAFKEIDTDGGGKILFDEFSKWALEKGLDLADDDS